jgi:hypothetical protein
MLTLHHHKLRVPLAEQKRLLEEKAKACDACTDHGKTCPECQRTGETCPEFDRLYVQFEEANARVKAAMQ